MSTLIPEEDEKTLVNQPAPMREDHSTWPSPPLSPISSTPPPSLVALPALRAPALPRNLLGEAQQQDESSE